MKRVLLVVANKNFPVPHDRLKAFGLDVHHCDKFPVMPHYCVGVAWVTKMSSHEMSHEARRLANQHGIPGGNANSVTGLMRLLESWKLIPVLKEVTIHEPSAIVSGGRNSLAHAEGVVIPAAQDVPIFIPTDADDLTDGECLPAPTPATEPEPVEEPTLIEIGAPVKKEFWKSKEFYVLALAGLPRGPYETARDIWRMSKKYQEFMVQKGPREAKPFKPNSFAHIVTAGLKSGVIIRTPKGMVIDHDKTMKLTPILANVERVKKSIEEKISRQEVLAITEGIVPADLFSVAEWDALALAAVSARVSMKSDKLVEVVRGFRKDFITDCIRKYILELAGLQEARA